MSTIIRCDGDDCFKMDTNFDGDIYSISERASTFLEGCQHLCADCLEIYTEDLDLIFEVINDHVFLKDSHE